MSIAASEQSTAAPLRPLPALKPLIREPASNAPVRLLVFADGPGATQTISFDLPLRGLRRQGRIEMLMLSEADFEPLSPMTAERTVEDVFASFRPTHVVVSRFAGPGAAGIVASARRAAIGYVMHLDDNLFAVPAEIGPAKFKKYNDPRRLNRLRLLCERAARIYVSTGPLKTQLDALGFSPPIEAGEIYCAAWTSMTPFAHSATPVVGYMGTAGHIDDLEVIAPALLEVMTLRPNVRFETFGSIKAPKSLKAAFGDRIRETRAAGSYLEFLELFGKMNWRCGLAPLRDTSFNACKASTKFIEYTLAGIPVIASDLPVYGDVAADGRGQLAGATADWTAAILAMLDDADLASRTAAKAQAHVAGVYTVDRLRDQVVRILEIPV